MNDDTVFQAWLNATNAYRVGMGLAPLKKEYMAESEKFLYADEDEPDRYNMDEHDDERLDSPTHDQCRDGKFKE